MPKKRPEHVPMRTCAVCRTVQPKRSMSRLVRDTAGVVAADPTGKAPGRGTYVCNKPDCREPNRFAQSVTRALGAAPGPNLLDHEENHAAT